MKNLFSKAEALLSRAGRSELSFIAIIDHGYAERVKLRDTKRTCICLLGKLETLFLNRGIATLLSRRIQGSLLSRSL